MQYDFHIHTSRYSYCARSSPEDICAKAVKTGLSGIALTEHDFWWPVSELRKLRKEFPDLKIFHGVEVDCQEGHFLVFLPNPGKGYVPESYSILQLMPEVHEQGGIIIWAHPFRFHTNMPDWLDEVQPDGIETASSNMDDQMGKSALQIAIQRKIMAFQNSDAHHIMTLGKYYNEIPVVLEHTKDFIDYVKKAEIKQIME